MRTQKSTALYSTATATSTRLAHFFGHETVHCYSSRARWRIRSSSVNTTVWTGSSSSIRSLEYLADGCWDLILPPIGRRAAMTFLLEKYIFFSIISLRTTTIYPHRYLQIVYYTCLLTNPSPAFGFYNCYGYVFYVYVWTLPGRNERDSLQINSSSTPHFSSAINPLTPIFSFFFKPLQQHRFT